MEKRDIPQLVEWLAQPDLRRVTSLDERATFSPSTDRLEQVLDEWCTDAHSATRVLAEAGAIFGYVRVEWWWDAMTPRIAVVIAPTHRRRGLGTEAAWSCLTHLFTETPAHVVHASTPDWDEAGIGFAQRLGFERAGALRRVGIRAGSYFGTVEFELFRERWEEARAADR